MIKNLLEYQNLDRQRLELIFKVEGGRAKRELDAANDTVNRARQNLLALEDEAKNLETSFHSVERNLSDLFAQSDRLMRAKTTARETEIQPLADQISTLSGRIGAAANQLEKIGNDIKSKTKQFEDTKNAVMNAQTMIKRAQDVYAAQLDQIKPQRDKIEAQMDVIARDIDKNLLDKYRARRRAEPFGSTKDIVVQLTGGRCGACRMEMPLALVNKINTDGYIICEDCGRIVFK